MGDAGRLPHRHRPMQTLAGLLLLGFACQSARKTGSESPVGATASTAVDSSLAAMPAGTGACGGKICAHGRFPPPGWRPYSGSSAFNRKVPPNPPLMANSARIVERLLGDLSRQKQPANITVFDDGTAGWPTY